MPDDIVVNVSVPRQVGEQLQKATPLGVEIESVRLDAEQTSRFGIVEVMTIIAIVKSAQEMVKLALEIRNLLREANQPAAKMSLPGAASHIQVAASASDSELEEVVRSHFNGDARASV